MSPSSRPIIIVTGANSGVGFGICQRLLFQLCEKNPTDALPQGFAPNAFDDAKHVYDGLTLIMACRSTKRAEAARTKLLRLFEAHVETLRNQPIYDGHAHKFQENVNIEIHTLDLASVTSVFRFSEEMSSYPYISHLICNAGVASFSSIHWPACLKQLFTEPIVAITAPTFYLQHQGEISADGLGWVWQCNVFGHYTLFRAIEPLLLASTSPLGSRVIWMSSLEASPTFYEPEDWQLKKTEHSYESCKYQIDLIASQLDRVALRDPNGKPRIRHFVTQPGVCSTNVSRALAGPFLDMLKVILFYIGRMCGSPHHTIKPFKAAIGAVHLSLVSLAFITLSASTPVRFGAETDRWGAERVGLTEVKDWKTQNEEGEVLLQKCDTLFKSLKAAEEATVDYEVATEHM
ncbi:hypothetical protein BDZ94DRAFT_1162332 [Collybia nuda]|uniref:3-keto sterol reductase n=1 Tax=Collybia nuda TaxID=64659 RepID=A0A9P5Y8L3_9AGAR|nr:hypothetical protein BDZ94DRAFT_1162332 [Collybia nuda]